MIRPLASRDPGAIREALVRRGMDEGRALSAAHGIRAITLLIDSLDDHSRDCLTRTALMRGLEVVTGDGWVVLSGATTRIAALTRAGSSALPDAVAAELGEFLGRITDVNRSWQTSHGTVKVTQPTVVGIVNVTPDSFSDGGKYLHPDAGVAHVEELLEAGADMIDLGAESTRPGCPISVSVEEEWQRLQPVLNELTRQHPDVPVSVDTVKSEIAELALEAGAWAVNDVSALRLDPRIADVCADFGAGLVLNHSRGPFSEMAGYEHAKYEDVSAETACELEKAVEIAERGGVKREQIVLDPGLGFAKTPKQNCELLRGLPLLASLGLPIMVGPSRKRFLGEITGKDTLDRDSATAAACIAAFFGGACLFRVHDVERVKESLAVAEELRSQ